MRPDGTETLGEALDWFFSPIRRMFGGGTTPPPPTQQEERKAPKLNSFGNWVTGGILLAIITMVVGGIIIALTVSLWGILISIVGAVAWWFGDKELSPDPRTAGMLTIWDHPVSHMFGDQNEIVVGGRTILANYFPFFVNVVEFDMTNVDRNYEMTVLSGGLDVNGRPIDPVPLKGRVSVTLRPNINDALDYIQAGKMTRVFEQLEDIVYEQAKLYARRCDAETIARQSEAISGPLRQHLEDDVFERKSFGVEIVKIQARFDLPNEVQEALTSTAAEKYQRTGELTEYSTDTLAAKALQNEYQQDPNMAGRVPGLKECLAEIKQLRLIRDKRVARIETDGNVAGVVIRDLNMDMGPENTGNRRRGGS